jgi:hypothetical protein
MTSRTEAERKRWSNQGIIEKTIICECGGESDVILKCEDIGSFSLFDSTDSRLPEGTKVLVQIGSLSGEIKTVNSNKTKTAFIPAHYERSNITTRGIGSSVGKVVDVIEDGEVRGNTVIADIGGLFVEGIDRQPNKAKIGDFVEFKGVNYIWGMWIIK